jgi:hypothetical protein
MSRVVSSVRITPPADFLLGELSKQLGKPKAQVIEQALRLLEERIFWREVKQAFARGESEEMRNEHELWDKTVPDGLKKGRW